MDNVPVGPASRLAVGIDLASPIWQYADGRYVSTLPWNGSMRPDLVGSLTDTCNDWSSGASAAGRYGENRSVSGWWGAFTTSCSNTRGVICAQQ